VSSDELAPPFSYEQTARVLARLADLEHEIVLVGGQAVNFWANYYEKRVPELAEGAPYTSKDIDFIGPHAAVEECARRLGGTARLATIDDMNTPNTGVVLFVDEDKHVRQIDFLGAVAGVESPVETSVGAEVLDDEGRAVASFRVMHPVLCMLSRAHNVAYLPGYDTAHARNQLRAAIICARQFIRDVLQDDARAALGFNKKVLKEAGYGASLLVHARHGIDVLDAVVTDAGLPERFYSEHLPRARTFIKRRRAMARATEQRTAAWQPKMSQPNGE
jgi:hypothetical protein